MPSTAHSLACVKQNKIEKAGETLYFNKLLYFCGKIQIMCAYYSPMLQFAEIMCAYYSPMSQFAEIMCAYYSPMSQFAEIMCAYYSPMLQFAEIKC